MKKKSVTQKIREFYENNPGADPKGVAEKFGADPSIAYRVRAEQSDGVRVPKIRKPNPITLAMSVQLADMKGVVEIQLRNGTGELLGTLRLESSGLQYRRPNQKKPSDRSLTWDTLDKLMQLGLG
jgi:hypothetical protein